jgi:hypothetical protein
MKRRNVEITYKEYQTFLLMKERYDTISQQQEEVIKDLHEKNRKYSIDNSNLRREVKTLDVKLSKVEAELKICKGDIAESNFDVKSYADIYYQKNKERILLRSKAKYIKDKKVKNNFAN